MAYKTLYRKDFHFFTIGKIVKYISPCTFKSIEGKINDMELWERVQNNENPSQEDMIKLLEMLKFPKLYRKPNIMLKNLYTVIVTSGLHSGAMILIAANTLQEAEKLVLNTFRWWGGGFFEQVKGATIECDKPYIVNHNLHEL